MCIALIGQLLGEMKLSRAIKSREARARHEAMTAVNC